ncbi:MAG TPA: caspase family protein [Flavobacteriales bacterium]|nr:caspase family protein [Flavobacteriales bacterium]
MINRFFISICALVLCVISFGLQAQQKAQPIIDNGYYSIQDWAGAIHPSGKFYVKADRSVVCARDIKTDALIQTFRVPCIANNICFFSGGKYMVVETIGEIDEWCNRVVVFDFYTGKQIYESRGSAIINLGEQEYFYVYEKKQGDEEYYVYHKISPGNPVKIESKVPLVQYDSITVLTDKKGNRYNLYKWYDKQYFLTGKFESDTSATVPMEIDAYTIRKHIKDFKFSYEIKISDFYQYNTWAIAVNDKIFIQESADEVVVFSFELNKELARIDSVKIFNSSYHEKNQTLYLRNFHENSLVSINTQSLEKVKYPFVPYGHHYRILSDSTLMRTEINDYWIYYGLYNFKKGERSYKSDYMRNEFEKRAFFGDGRYFSSVAKRSNAIMHNNDFIIDTDKKLVKMPKYFIDTTLVHPAVIGFSPDSSGMLMVNEFFWNINSAQQIIKNEQQKKYFNTLDSTTYFPLKNADEKYHYLQVLPMHNFDLVSYPIEKTDAYDEDRVTIAYNQKYADLQNSIEYENGVLKNNNRVYIVVDDTLLADFPLQPQKKLQAIEKTFDNFLKNDFTTERIVSLNKLPEFTLYTAKQKEYNGEYAYLPPLKPQKNKKSAWYFSHYNGDALKPDLAYTSDEQTAVNAYIRNIFSHKITYANPLRLPFFQVSIINTNEMPDLGYAGIISRNDVYFNTLNIPATFKRIIGLNYAHGVVQLKNDKNELISESSFYKNGDFIHVLPNGYYFVSKGKLDRLSIRVDSVVYPVEQFDLKYNRPDIVLKAMGCTNETLIQTYKSAYLKRLKKMGFTEDMLKSDYHLPGLKIQEQEQIPLKSDSGKVHIKLGLIDTKYKLDRINVYVNDVPVYGANGIDLRTNNAQVLEKIIKLDLAQGENKIQVSVLNQAGAESYKENVHIVYKPAKDIKPNLYLISIGDSKYNDSRYNLTYASKDAEDIQTTFTNNELYANTFKYIFTNENVTKKNILNLKQELLKAKRDDVVIITVAGHGVLDKDLNYYLATYDMDFNNPAEKGLPYEALESLVDAIAPLKKVVFLDACHSGEVDKEEVEQLAMANTNSGEVKFRNAGSGIQKKNLGLKTTSELMGELFADLRRGTGATVVSSAGGAEYAMESDQWKNGLFTYCLLHGIKDKAADVNKDGQIMLSELQQYLRTEVTRLSHGAQQPTSRIENLNMDFRIW